MKIKWFLIRLIIIYDLADWTWLGCHKKFEKIDISLIRLKYAIKYFKIIKLDQLRVESGKNKAFVNGVERFNWSTSCKNKQFGFWFMSWFEVYQFMSQLFVDTVCRTSDGFISWRYYENFKCSRVLMQNSIFFCCNFLRNWTH